MTTAHEPRGGPGTHLSEEDLSALAEGAQPSAAGAAEHLLKCAACQDELDAISDLLAQFETWDTPPIPQDVAIRIDAALARESAVRAGGMAAGSAVGEKSSEKSGLAGVSASPAEAPAPSRTATHTRRRRRFATSGLGWALASLIVLAGGLGLVLKLASSSTTNSVSSASSGSGTAALPNSGAVSPDLGANRAQSGPATLAPNSQLAQWTMEVLSRHEAGAQAASTCTPDPAFGGRQQLATTTGPYQGTPSTLVVYSNPADPSTVLAVVYATPCTTANHRVLAMGLVAR